MTAIKLVEKEKARNLRLNGMSLKDISEKVGVAKSSVSIWVRDMPTGGVMVTSPISLGTSLPATAEI